MIENFLKLLITLHLKATIINILLYFIPVLFLYIFFNIFNIAVYRIIYIFYYINTIM